MCGKRTSAHVYITANLQLHDILLFLGHSLKLYSVMARVVYFLFLLSVTAGSVDATRNSSDQTGIHLPCSKFFCFESCGIICSIIIDSGKYNCNRIWLDLV